MGKRTSPERWENIERIYHSALRLDPERRENFLREACAGDEALLQEVASLLAGKGEMDALFDSPAWKGVGQLEPHKTPPLDLTGRTLAHYRIVEKIGEGGMGTVYRAEDGHLKRPVAVKLLPPDRVSDPERKRRFVKEARAASALNHPHIVTIHDIGQAEGVDFIVMEYLAGRTLDRVIPAKGMPLDKALDVSIQMADALTAAHSVGIVHRDFKPSNVILSDSGQAKILDFGLAKLVAGPDQSGENPPAEPPGSGLRTDEGMILGTAAYMSPEQAQGQKVDTRSDIFSFGAVLYEMVSGQRAFRGENPVGTLASIITQEPAPLPSGLPAELQGLIARCLKKDPNRRIQHIEEVKVSLEDLRDSRASQGSAIASPAPSRRWRRWLLALALAIPLLAFVAWLLWYGPQTALPPPEVVALTSDPGNEFFPSFSPDGKQVAYCWNGGNPDNNLAFDIYVRHIESGTSLPLTTDPAPESRPAWSPDGSQIAFVRYGKPMPSICLVSPLGGPARKLTAHRPSAPAAAGLSYVSWSPDGGWLAVAEQDSNETSSIFLLPVQQGERRKLVSGPVSQGYFALPTFSPDGRHLACIVNNRERIGDLLLFELDRDLQVKGPARRLWKHVPNINGIAWAPDRRSLIVGAARMNTQSLYRCALNEDTTPEHLAIAGDGSSMPAVSRTGNRLAYTFRRSVTAEDIWNLEPAGPRKNPVSSTRNDFDPQLSADRRQIAFVSNRSGRGGGLWVADAADGTGMTKLTETPDRYVGSPRWSPDGRWIAFDGQSPDGQMDIFVIDAAGGHPRRITPYPSNEALPAWSGDGKSIYFCSNQTKRWEIWRIPWEGGQAERLTGEGGFESYESLDGKSLYYTKQMEDTRIFMRPIAGGKERQIITTGTGSNLDFFPVDGGLCYITRQAGGHTCQLWFLDSATEQSRVIQSFQAEKAYALYVSPDRKTVLYAGTERDSSGVDLILVENFR